ncbi:methylmalonyl-CoA epimerase [Adhaeribacter arboris]|uniref:Methylmalonyl-CoA epimerase n=1 Tax=Adhaeribacter arboris TaxID=2072846 RepID=A0A2T2YCR9_9BACT|nr:methylmalonyl-CoA epimerase [Adhaeribacter arboris]PSR53307.1 methylmalonyl-CoA epimerase [Adhaeribacter arboris]
MNKIEHIGIAVQNLEKANLIYTQILGSEPYKTEQVASEKVMTSFFRCGESKIELLAATDETSVIAGFIQKRGEGMHHIAFAVEDIEAEMNRLRQAGFTLLNETPKPGADNKLVCFVHPKSTNGVLIELCQERR